MRYKINDVMMEKIQGRMGSVKLYIKSTQEGKKKKEKEKERETEKETRGGKKE